MENINVVSLKEHHKTILVGAINYLNKAIAIGWDQPNRRIHAK